jgi:copper chaperone CopZ
VTVKKELSKLNLDNVQVELGIVKIYYDETKISTDKIERAIEEAGYKVRKD